VKNVQSVSAAPTRGQVARLILELGPSTAATLGSRLGLTPAAIRRHLDNLIAEGLIETRTARTYGNRGRGRPAKVFVITDAGRSAFEHAYDDLATNALRFLAEAAGPDAIAEFARRQLADLERRYAPAVAQGNLAARVQALAEALSADGYAASAGPAPAIGGGRDGGVGSGSPGATGQGAAGEQLCQHHCPVAHVRDRVPAAVRGGDRGLRQAARHAGAAARYYRARRRHLHHARHLHDARHRAGTGERRAGTGGRRAGTGERREGQGEPGSCTRGIF
jgi:predicted ArsR family transcriptional regulator